MRKAVTSSKRMKDVDKRHARLSVFTGNDRRNCGKAPRQQSGQDRWFVRIGGLEGDWNLVRIRRGLPIVVSGNRVAGRIVQVKRGILQRIHNSKIA